MRQLVIAVVLVAAAAGLCGWYWYSHRGAAVGFRTAKVARGDLRLTISATGTVEPEEVVDVGAQVAGQVKSLGEDPKDPSRSIDYGTAVEEGTVLARIDDSLYAADVAQSSAAVDAAKANQERAEADVVQMKAKQTQAERDFRRAQDLQRTSPGAITPQDYDMFQAAYETTKAAVAVGEATAAQARKSVTQAEAVRKKAQTNLDYCTIRSPVKGVIVDRRVNVGQTVVSSLNAPSLFLIAKDLKRLQVWVSVNEADIGQVRAGQPVSFTVDAHPKETFKGTVNKIRLNATMTNNVVTYTVEVSTDNSSGRLLPYMTANVLFQVGEHADVLIVPNAALRWRPQPGMIAGDVEVVGGDRRKGKDREAADAGTIWVPDGDRVRPIRVKVGWNDAANTEVEAADLEPGTEVVVGTAGGGDAGGTSNPFAPKMFGGGGNKSGQ